MKTKLITALRTAAKAIEDGTIAYKWSHSDRCNCGVLACAVTGKSPVQLRARIPSGETWEEFVGTHCPITGVPEHEILRALFNVGLTQRDLIELEYLSNETVLKRAGLLVSKPRLFRAGSKTEDLSEYDDADDVVAYMRAWADLLTEEGKLDRPTPEHAETLVS